MKKLLIAFLLCALPSFATNYYVRSSAAGAGTGADWADAFTTLTTAFATAVAGDTLWVADDHAESTASAVTLASAGTVGNPIYVIGTNTHTTQPPTATGQTATVSTTGSNGLTFTGYAYYYGIIFSAGSSSNTANITMASSSALIGLVFDGCSMRLGNTAAGSRIQLGNAGASLRDLYVVWNNTTVKFNNASQVFNIESGRMYWRNTASALISGTLPTTLFTTTSVAPATVEVSGVDLSALGSGHNLVNISNGTLDRFYFRNCKLGASVSVTTSTILDQAAVEVYLENSDSGNTTYRFADYKYPGSILSETTHVRSSGGATDGTTTISHAMASLATGPTPFFPLEGPWITQWNQTTGSAITATVELCTENVTLTSDQVWLEVEALDTSGYPQSVWSTTHVASQTFGTPANLTTSSATWSGFTTAAPQKLALTFTPQVKGLIRARVVIGAPSLTVYVDPQIAVGSGPSIGRSYITPGGASGLSINETSGSTCAVASCPIAQ